MASQTAPAKGQPANQNAPGQPPPSPTHGLSGPLKALFERIEARIKEAIAFTELLPEVEDNMLKFLQAVRLTVYQNGRDGQEIIAKYKSGGELLEIKLPLSPSSIAGYVALSQKPIRISDVNEPKLLTDIHKSLKFDKSFDKRSGFTSKAMMAVPIKVGAPLLGVIQVINKVGGGDFTDEDLKRAQLLAKLIGEKFHEEFEGTNSPYEYLIKKGKVTQEKIDSFSKRTKKEGVTMTYLLVSEMKIPPEMIAASLESYHQVPFMRYDPEVMPPKKLMKKLNLSYLRRQRWVPVAGDENELVILIDDPSDMTRQMEIQRALPAKKYIFRIGFEEDILQYLGGGSVSSFLHGLAGKLEDEDVEEGQQIDEGDETAEINENESTIIQLVNRLIIDAQRAGASDIHIEPAKGRMPSKVRLRIDGMCRHALEIPSTHIRAVMSRIKIMSRLDIAERRKPQDGKIVVKVQGKPLELRVATLPTVHGEGAVMRVLAAGGALPFDKLNLSDYNYRETKRLISIPYGIFLVVGPTGSGKTTTLHAVLGEINTPDRKIWTAEDPVEITQPGLCQMQMEPKIGLTFATALRAFLRADPDVILIGEMRDEETAHSGIEASLTGHLVFSTLHTNSAPETITRLLDLGLDPLNFSDAVLGVLAQRLVRTLCKDCKQRVKPSDTEWKRLVGFYGEEYFPELEVTRESAVIFAPNGCGKCNKTGYKGRTGIHELLVVTDELKRMIASSAKAAELREEGIKGGMRTLIQDGVAKVLKGQLDLEQLFRVATD
ncbi:MAG: GspE/PulE family protein [Magnetococcales bacterium]|nr:GspE/PulE family protein [Magnetococcales bacterium]